MEVTNDFGQRQETYCKVYELFGGSLFIERIGRVARLEKITQEQFEELRKNGGV